MEVSTAAQPSSGHQKRYIPIVAGTLGGCGLILILGCLFYLFLRRRRRRYGPRGPVRAKGSEPQTCNSMYRSFSGFHTTDQTEHSSTIEGAGNNVVHLWTTASLKVLSSREKCIRRTGSLMQYSPPFDLHLEAEDPWDWNSNFDFSGLSELPFADVDLQTDFNLDHQNPDASTVQASSDLQPSCDKGFPLDVGLGLGNPVDGGSDVYLSGSRALPFVNPGPQTIFASDHQISTSNLVPNREDDFLAWCNNPPNLPSAPSASNTEPPNDLTLSPLPTNIEPPISPSTSQAPPKPESLPLPPAPTLRCPNCPQKFSSRLRLE